MQQNSTTLQAWRELASQAREADLDLDMALERSLTRDADVPVELIRRVARLRIEAHSALTNVVEVIRQKEPQRSQATRRSSEKPTSITPRSEHRVSRER